MSVVLSFINYAYFIFLIEYENSVMKCICNKSSRDKCYMYQTRFEASCTIYLVFLFVIHTRGQGCEGVHITIIRFFKTESDSVSQLVQLEVIISHGPHMCYRKQVMKTDSGDGACSTKVSYSHPPGASVIPCILPTGSEEESRNETTSCHYHDTVL